MVNGHCKVEGQLSSERIQVNGYLEGGGEVIGKRVEVNGMLSTRSELDCEELKVHGRISAKEIFARRVQFPSSGLGKLGKIYSFETRMKTFGKRGWMSSFLPPNILHHINGYLSGTVESIVGDTVQLEGVRKADYIGGNHVEIEGECEVKELHYSTSLKLGPKVVVHSLVKRESPFDFDSLFTNSTYKTSRDSQLGSHNLQI